MNIKLQSTKKSIRIKLSQHWLTAISRPVSRFLFLIQRFNGPLWLAETYQNQFENLYKLGESRTIAVYLVNTFGPENSLHGAEDIQLKAKIDEMLVTEEQKITNKFMPIAVSSLWCTVNYSIYSHLVVPHFWQWRGSWSSPGMIIHEFSCSFVFDVRSSFVFVHVRANTDEHQCSLYTCSCSFIPDSELFSYQFWDQIVIVVFLVMGLRNQIVIVSFLVVGPKN